VVAQLAWIINMCGCSVGVDVQQVWMHSRCGCSDVVLPFDREKVGYCPWLRVKKMLIALWGGGSLE
jgi:hypothetical protein